MTYGPPDGQNNLQKHLKCTEDYQMLCTMNENNTLKFFLMFHYREVSIFNKNGLNDSKNEGKSI